MTLATLCMKFRQATEKHAVIGGKYNEHRIVFSTVNCFQHSNCAVFVLSTNQCMLLCCLNFLHSVLCVIFVFDECKPAI